MQRLRLLNRFFFQELGFAGNVNDYYDARNSYLHSVLQTRRGIPITLAMLYVEIAGQIGLAASGISFPGHFLVKLRMPQGEVVIDPFTGQSMSRDALDALLVPYRRREGLPGESPVPLALFLQAATPREIIARMLRNLKEIHRNSDDWPRLFAVAAAAGHPPARGLGGAARPRPGRGAARRRRHRGRRPLRLPGARSARGRSLRHRRAADRARPRRPVAAALIASSARHCPRCA